MKNKDLKKLTKKLEEIISNNIKNSLDQPQKYNKCVEIDEDYRIAEYDEEVSNKFKKLALNLIDYTENLNINVNSNRINISTGDLKSVKKKSCSNSNQLVDSDEHYLEVSISRESFSINRGYSKRSHYKDTEMYAYLFPIVTAKLQEINSNNFSEIWSEIMKDSGMMRDNNLDNLFPNADE